MRQATMVKCNDCGFLTLLKSTHSEDVASPGVSRIGLGCSRELGEFEEILRLRECDAPRSYRYGLDPKITRAYVP